MKNTKPELITHLILDDGADGYHRYHVRVPVRIAEEIGCEVHRGRTLLAFLAIHQHVSHLDA